MNTKEDMLKVDQNNSIIILQKHITSVFIAYYSTKMYFKTMTKNFSSSNSSNTVHKTGITILNIAKILNIILSFHRIVY